MNIQTYRCPRCLGKGFLAGERACPQCNPGGDFRSATRVRSFEEQPTPPAYSLGNLTYTLEFEADCLRERGYHDTAQKFEAVARLLREWHSTLEQVKRESCQMGSDFGNQKIYDLVVDALAKVKP